MPQPKHLDPSAFSADGGSLGVLLLHGFTGSAAETRPMGEYLAARGWTVRCPLLPGHGTEPGDLNRICKEDWTGTAEATLRELHGRCQVVFVGGLSLGSLLTLWLGLRDDQVAGLILLAPAIKFRDRRAPLVLALRHVIEYSPFDRRADSDLSDPEAIHRIWCYDELPLRGAAEVLSLQREVRKRLAEIRQPTLIVQGRRDKDLDPHAAEIVYRRIGAVDKTLIWLERSGHNVLVDGERQTVWAQSNAWMLARCEAGVDGAFPTR